MSSEIRISKTKMKFFKQRGTTNPTVSLEAGASASNQANVTLKLPNTLPSDNSTNVVIVDKDTGQMSYSSGGGGGGTISGTFNPENLGAVGLQSGENLTSVASKIDDWIFKYLVDKPPAPLKLQFAENSTTTLTVTWDAPSIYYLGILDETIPHIENLVIKVYKATNTTPQSIGAVSHSANSDQLTSSNLFGSVSVGDSVTVPGSSWSTGTAKVKGTTNSGNSLVTDGWSANPSSFGGTVFRIADHPGEYIISNVAGSWSDVNTEITLTLDRNLTSSATDNSNLIHEETKVVIAKADNSNLTVDSQFVTTVSGTTGTYIPYSNSSQTVTLTNTNYIPKKGSSTIIEAFRMYIDGGGTGTDGTINSKNIYRVQDSPSLSNSGGKFIYVDTTSHNLLFDASNKQYSKSNSTGGGTAINYPVKQVLTSNSTDTPTVGSSGVHVAYDHSELIVGNSSNTYYNNEIQFVNGRHRTVSSSDAFLDYTGYLDVGAKTMNDYSGASNSEFRYSTFLYDISGNPQKAISYIDLKFYNYTLHASTTVAGSGLINSSHIKLYVKLIDNGQYTPQGDESDFTSVWLDGNAIANSAVTVSKTNWSTGSAEPRAALENASSGNTQSNTSGTLTRRILLVPGTDTNNLKILVRIGFLQSVDNSFGYITVEYDNS